MNIKSGLKIVNASALAMACILLSGCETMFNVASTGFWGVFTVADSVIKMKKSEMYILPYRLKTAQKIVDSARYKPREAWLILADHVKEQYTKGNYEIIPPKLEYQIIRGKYFFFTWNSTDLGWDDYVGWEFDQMSGEFAYKNEPKTKLYLWKQLVRYLAVDSPKVITLDSYTMHSYEYGKRPEFQQYDRDSDTYEAVKDMYFARWRKNRKPSDLPKK